MRESLLDDPKTLFSGIGTIVFAYAAGIALAVNGSIYSILWLVVAVTYTALLVGTLADAFRVVFAAFIAVGLMAAAFALVAATHLQYRIALDFAAYSLWVLTTVAAPVFHGYTTRGKILIVIAHGLALLGFGFATFVWQWDVPFAGASIAVTLALWVSIGYDHHAWQTAGHQADSTASAPPQEPTLSEEPTPDGTGNQPDEPALRELMLERAPHALAYLVLTPVICYIIGIRLLVHGSIHSALFLAVAVTYTALVASLLTNLNRLITGIVIGLVGIFMLVLSVIATADHTYRLTVDLAAYGLWALVFIAAVKFHGDTLRGKIMIVGAHLLALLGFILVVVAWQWDISFAALSVATSLTLCLSIAHDHRSWQAADRDLIGVSNAR